jgi:hypothetical protein
VHSRLALNALLLSTVLAGAVVVTGVFAAAPVSADFHDWAPTPPMGWNSWDCFGATVTEAQTKAQADVMAAQLKPHGWQYIVVDIQWYEPGAQGHSYRAGAPLSMDEFGRLTPAVNRFPSAANGAGFKPLADYVHALGLKFGVHLMRGIPRLAVERNLPVKGTDLRARDIADRNSVCPWNPDMYGVDMKKPGAQAYYDSVFALFGEWGVDYVKVDDISRPYFEHQQEIEGVRHAIDHAGRPMVLSLSPGETALAAAEHVNQHANLWRISDDFWDRWLALRAQFARLAKWNPYRIAGAWPDADMLPLGMLNFGKPTRFTPEEQRLLLTLWSIARSPLMHGGDMTRMDPATLALLTNDEVLAVNQHSTNNRPVFERDQLIAWTADVPDSPDKYLAVFNAQDRVRLTPENASSVSPVVTRGPGSAKIDVDLTGATKLFLLVDPTDDGENADFAVWMEPTLTMADGSTRRLTELKWTAADALWENVSTEKAPGGKPMTHAGRPVPFGIATNGASLVEYALPAGAVRLTATGAVDDAALGDPSGGTVRFVVVAARPQDERSAAGIKVPVSLREIGFTGAVRIRDLWTHADLGRSSVEFAPAVPFHGAGLYRISPE